jgi:hypothetical protein
MKEAGLALAALGPTNLPVRWMKNFLSPVAKQLGHGIDCRPPVRAELKKSVELYLHHMSSARGTVLRTGIDLLFNACATSIFVFGFIIIFRTL